MSSQVISVAKNAASLKAGKRAQEYTKVILHVTDDVSYTVGNDLGLTMEYTNPFGTPEMARNILASIAGYQHQSFDAASALLDPAAQLGDGLDINGIYGGIATMTSRYGPHFTADVGAPAIQEIDQKAPYKSSEARQVERKFLETYAKLSIQADQIAAEVEARTNDVEQLNALLTVQANQIAAEVTARKNDVEQLNAYLSIQADQISAKVSSVGGNFSSFGYVLTDKYWEVATGYKRIFRVDETGAEVSGKITAESGKIGGFDIQSNYLSFNNHTWGGTNTIGAYIGTNGIQLGRNCKIDMQGNAEFENANIRGTLRAGDLIYGGDAGYLPGSGLESHTVSGNQLQYGTVSTAYTSGGINTSLGYANFADDVFNGNDTAGYVGTYNLKLDGHWLNRASVTIAGVSLKYVSWI